MAEGKFRRIVAMGYLSLMGHLKNALATRKTQCNTSSQGEYTPSQARPSGSFPFCDGNLLSTLSKTRRNHNLVDYKTRRNSFGSISNTSPGAKGILYWAGQPAVLTVQRSHTVPHLKQKTTSLFLLVDVPGLPVVF